MTGWMRFTEEMAGFFLPRAPACDTGYENGRAEHSSLMFHLTIGSADVGALLKDPGHVAPARGWIEAPRLGAGRLPVERGTFNLFIPGRKPGRLAMHYCLWFLDGTGEPRTLLGVKDVGNDPGFDLWKDTTSLAVQILDGHVDDGKRARVLGRGILLISPSMFARQLRSFRGDPVGVARFGAFFALRLFLEYGSRAWQRRKRPL
jgi:cholesterol oxidase